MFNDYPAYNRYRTLCYSAPLLRGEDVYALQTALNELGFAPGTEDGIFGSKTDLALRSAQAQFRLVQDGKAGPVTQREIALQIAGKVAAVQHVPLLAFKGQLQLESNFILGNYSPIRPDGTFDAGVAQRNTKFTPASDGFDCQLSIEALGQSTRKFYNLFSGIDTGEKRRWGLAQGAWNAPAFACYIAREEGAEKVTSGMVLKPSSEARETFEAYVQHASVYLT